MNIRLIMHLLIFVLSILGQKCNAGDEPAKRTLPRLVLLADHERKTISNAVFPYELETGGTPFTPLDISPPRYITNKVQVLDRDISALDALVLIQKSTNVGVFMDEVPLSSKDVPKSMHETLATLPRKGSYSVYELLSHVVTFMDAYGITLKQNVPKPRAVVASLVDKRISISMYDLSNSHKNRNAVEPKNKVGPSLKEILESAVEPKKDSEPKTKTSQPE